MGRSKLKEKESRLNIKLTTETRQKLENLMLESGADSMTEVIRRSLAIYDELVKFKKLGGDVILKSDKPDEPERILMIA